MSRRIYITASILLAISLFLVACGVAVAPQTDPPTQAPAPRPTQGDATPAPDGEEPANRPPLQVTEVPASEWYQLLSRDSIRPIYDPEFVSAAEAGYDDDELVMGVTINGESKAYLITVLNRREMVNDELGGIPILATW